MQFQPAIPTRGTKVPAGPEWLHEVKYDGFRLIVSRDGDRVRLITRGGYDCSSRYPWIGESALKNRIKQFVIDGEAVVLGVDGISDFEALYSRKHDDEVQLYAFDILALDGKDLRGLPLSMRKTNLARRPGGIFVAPFEAGEIGSVPGGLPDGAGGFGLEAAGPPVSGWPVEALDQDQEPQPSGDEAGDGSV
jgi:bifunctional non-homologous end joining protein LigD